MKKLLIRFCLGLGLVAMLNDPTLADRFQEQIKPYLQRFCIDCHGEKEPKGGLNLLSFDSDRSLILNFRKWDDITTFIRSGEMPPKGSPQPELEQSNAVLNAVESVLLQEARKHAGDPGFVPPRRLSNTEYNHSIRDLTGIDIQPTRNFPPDPAGGEGFDNTGEALSMSPNLLKKYLSAAQEVADHLLLRTDGIIFAPTPAVSYNERRKLTELAIIDFYNQRQVDIRAYVQAAWRYRYLSESSAITLEQQAEANGLSVKYLSLVWKTLSTSSSGEGFMKRLGTLWEAVPAPIGKQSPPVEFNELMNFIEFGRKTLTPPLKGLIKSNAGNWPIHWLDFRAKTAAVRDQFSPENIQSEALVNGGQVPVYKEGSKPYKMTIRFQRGYSDQDGYVVIKRPLFSFARILPQSEKDETENHKVVTLKAVLEKYDPELAARMKFGTHPVADSIPEAGLNPEWVVMQVPAVMEISFTPEMQRQLQGKHLLLQCLLDSKASRDASVFVRQGNGNEPLDQFDEKTTHLIYRDSAAATR